MGNCNCKSATHTNVVGASAYGDEEGPISQPPVVTQGDKWKETLSNKQQEQRHLSRDENESSNNTPLRRTRQATRQAQAATTSSSPLADAQQQQSVSSLQPSDVSAHNVSHTTATLPSSSTNNQPSAPATATATSSTSMDIDPPTVPSSSTNNQLSVSAAATSSNNDDNDEDCSCCEYEEDWGYEDDGYEDDWFEVEDTESDLELAIALLESKREEALKLSGYNPEDQKLIRAIWSEIFIQHLHNHRSVWEINKLIAVGGMKVLMDHLLDITKQAKSGVPVAAVWMVALKCGVGENGGRSYHFMGMIEKALQRKYWNTPTGSVLPIVSAATPTMDVGPDTKNGLQMAVVEARNHCRRNVDSNGVTRTPKHCPAWQKLEVEQVTGLLEQWADYMKREFGTKVFITGGGGQGTDAFFYGINPFSESIVHDGIGTAHFSTLTSVFNFTEEGKKGNMRKALTDALQFSRRQRNMAIEMVEHCKKMGVEATLPASTFFEIALKSRATCMVADPKDPEAFALVTERHSEQGRNGLLAAASKKARREITNTSEAGRTLGEACRDKKEEECGRNERGKLKYYADISEEYKSLLHVALELHDLVGDYTNLASLEGITFKGDTAKKFKTLSEKYPDELLDKLKEIHNKKKEDTVIFEFNLNLVTEAKKLGVTVRGATTPAPASRKFIRLDPIPPNSFASEAVSIDSRFDGGRVKLQRHMEVKRINEHDVEGMGKDDMKTIMQYWNEAKERKFLKLEVFSTMDYRNVGPKHG